MEKTMDKIIALAKARGFVYPGSEIYGGLANTWDYGNLGVELKNNVKRAWWQKFIQESPYNVGVDCAILMNPQTWVASGHLGSFSDPLMDCKECHERFRADKIIEDYSQEHGIELESSVDGWSQEEMKNFIEEHNVPCPSCGKHNFTDIRQFNLMFKTFQGVTEDAKNTVYLRPETAQGIFVNFKNVQRTSRKKIPFGIGQIGKSFRNEITPGNFTDLCLRNPDFLSYLHLGFALVKTQINNMPFPLIQPVYSFPEGQIFHPGLLLVFLIADLVHHIKRIPAFRINRFKK